MIKRKEERKRKEGRRGEELEEEKKMFSSGTETNRWDYPLGP